MSGDYSSNSFDALRDFVGVFMQQGHATLDADWNELVAILERRLRAETVDIIGRAVVPLETPDGFRILLAAGPALEIGRGRMYVDGLLAENHGLIGEGNPPIFDRTRQIDDREVGVLDESISRQPGDFVDYAAQPYLPNPPELPQGQDTHLAYLDVWKREVTPLKDPSLLEPALGGIDTATRWQTVWQVRLLEDVGPNVNCATPDVEIPRWPETRAPSAVRLTNGTIEFEDPNEPCVIPPGGGYRGLENQLYRVEIHSGSDLSDARFKWSRENASVGARVETIQSNNRLTVRRIGRDSVLRFQTNDWVEITDDIREFHGLSGDIRRVTVDEDSRLLELSSALSADLIPSGVDNDTLAARNTRVIRWDQSGQVFLADGTPWENLDDLGSDGLIPVPTDGSAVLLEAGVTVSFSMEPEDGALHPMDYWCFAARTAGAQIEPLVQAPPQGIHHHYARLAVIRFPNTVQDCRIFWPPQFGEGEGCACTVCVTAEGHNSGALTIQAAIDQLPAEGGTVCLDTGSYLLGSTPVVISGRNSVRLRGKGSASSLSYSGEGGAIRIQGSGDSAIEDLSVVATAPAPPPPPYSAIHLRNVLRTAVRRVVLLVVGQPDRDIAIAQDGFQIAVKIEECLIAAPTGIGILQQEEPGYLALWESRIFDNILAANRAIAYTGPTLQLSSVDVGRNLIFAAQGGGMHFTGAGLPAALLMLRSNSVVVNSGDGIVVGIPNSRLQDNQVVIDGEEAGSAIVFREGLLPEQAIDAQVIANRLRGRFGILIETEIESLLIKRNVIRDCLLGAISMSADASVQTLAIDNNVIERIAANGAGQLLAAVVLSQVGDAQIAGNLIRAVGNEAANVPLIAGVMLRGVERLLAKGNSISQIGAEEGGPEAIALLIEEPFVMVDASDNQLNGSQQPGATFASWTGLAILRQSFSTGLTTLPAVFEAANGSLFALGNFRLRALGEVRDSQVTVQGNQMVDSHNGGRPMVLIDLRPESACLFNGNQCRLLIPGGAPELVRIAAPRVVAGNNIVRRASEQVAMRLVVGQGGRATVIGNLSFGDILVEPGGLPPEMQPLNLISP